MPGALLNPRLAGMTDWPDLPLGAEDYPVRPRGAALMLEAHEPHPTFAETLAAELRAAGWPIHGLGPLVRSPQPQPGRYLFIALDRQAPEEALFELGAALDRRTDLTVMNYWRPFADPEAE